ncbi:hypothetical protein IC620_05580 [Hazenella sp. IB182357]|uniref:Uncharacterized protein n=1 Tax=Polycladospora coralii TaxID=2771432 RepID=A0A926N8V3_9BACL|nr:hypothetical protein [Polycladospora coralii]MBD1371828.1 hypothetical protein [Polycladospora coralii]MBS7529289.1 hypothetical protein [Polycladospora coralii]
MDPCKSLLGALIRFARTHCIMLQSFTTPLDSQVENTLTNAYDYLLQRNLFSCLRRSQQNQINAQLQVVLNAINTRDVSMIIQALNDLKTLAMQIRNSL